MGKVIKILVSVLSSLLLVAIILPITLSLLLHINSVQNFVVRNTTTILSKNLGTKISIENVAIKLFNRVSLDGFYVEDYAQDTLIYAENVTVGISRLSLKNKNFAFSYIKLKNTQFSMREMPEGESNFKQILNKLKNEDKTEKTTFTLSASRVEVDTINYTFTKLEPRYREYGVNFDDLSVSNASLSGSDLVIVGDSINLEIKNISLKEKSGLNIKSLSSEKFIISNTCLRADQLKAQMPRSNLNAEYLYFSYDSWQDYSDFINVVDIRSSITNTRVSSQSIAFFAPKLRKWNNTLRNVNASISGSIADMHVKISGLKTQTNTSLAADVKIKGIPNVEAMNFDIKVADLKSNSSDARQIIEGFAVKDNIANNSILAKLGNIDLKGDFKGLLTDFVSQAKVKTSAGDVNFSVEMTEGNGRRIKQRINAQIDAKEVDLGYILNNQKLQTISLSSEVNLRNLINGNISADIIASIPSFGYNDYNYSGLHINGVIDNQKYQGLIVSQDENMKFEFDGLLDFEQAQPRYDFDLNLTKTNLAKLNFNKRDSISMLSCYIKANGSGDNLDNINGAIEIDKLRYINHIDTVKTDLIRIVGNNNEQSKSITLNSSFADLSFKSRISYEQMNLYLESLMGEYLPLLSSLEQRQEIDYSSKSVTSNITSFSLIKLDVKQANNVAGIFLPGLNIAQGTTLSLITNPEDRKFSFTLKSDYIDREGFFVSNLNINSYNQADSLSFFLRADDLYTSGIYMPNLSIIGEARENSVDLSARFNNKEQDISALINLNSSVHTNQDSLPEVLLTVKRSNLTNKDKVWDISSNEILYKKDRLEVNDFEIHNKDQHLIINGIASKQNTDTLSVKLAAFDISPLSNFVQNMGYELSGQTTGNVHITSLLHSPNIFANIDLQNAKVNQVEIPKSKFLSLWDFERNRARFMLTSEGIEDNILLGYYSPSDGRYLADITLPKVNLALLDPLLKGVLVGSKGTANAKLQLRGQGAKPLLSGDIQIDSLLTKVAYTNVDYRIDNTLMKVNNNTFTAQGVNVFDTEGNSARLNLTLNNQYFKNFSFELGITPSELMVLNTTPAQNDLFYGTVFASGGARIRGNSLGVNMDVIASTDENSTFIMPLSGKSDISYADFIVFTENKSTVADSTDFLIRKRQIMERKKRYTSSENSNFNISMALTVNPNAEFTLEMDPTAGGTLKGRGNGTINININPRNEIFTMYGDYNVTEGVYLFSLQNLIHKRFDLMAGSSIVWTGDPVDAMLDMTAIYNVKASLEPLVSSSDDQYNRNVPVECQITLTDRLLQPTITFDVLVPSTEPEIQTLVANALNTQEMMATQFFTLLAFGSFYSDTNTSQNSNIGAMGGSVTGFEFLTNQLSNWISSDKYNIGIRYRPKGDLTSDELDVGLSTALIENRLLLEFEGNYDFGNNSSSTSTTANSLTGDFYLTWLMDRAGSLQAKAFSRTVDRFDENQGLQENGVGIYYSENFNTFKDIITNFRNRFKRKAQKKEQKKEQRQSEKELNDSQND